MPLAAVSEEIVSETLMVPTVGICAPFAGREGNQQIRNSPVGLHLHGLGYIIASDQNCRLAPIGVAAGVMAMPALGFMKVAAL
jgi:hypothetical protein